jgi:hypothetical protein
MYQFSARWNGSTATRGLIGAGSASIDHRTNANVSHASTFAIAALL